MLCAGTHTVWPVGLQKQLSRAIRMYERRVEWLSLASRRIWGTVCEKRYFPLRSVLVCHGLVCNKVYSQLTGSLLEAAEAIA